MRGTQVALPHLLLLAVVGLALLVIGSQAAAPSSVCSRSDQVVEFQTTKPGPYGTEELALNSAALADLLEAVDSALDKADCEVSYWATHGTLLSTYLHAASFPFSFRAELAVLADSLGSVHELLWLKLSPFYDIEVNTEDRHMRVTALREGQRAAHVDILIYETDALGLVLSHPWSPVSFPARWVFPTVMAAHQGKFIRVPADSQSYLTAIYGAQLRAPEKSFSWTQLKYVSTPGSQGVYPLVSIIIPTYDRPQFLSKALQHITRQDYPNIEVVIVDDGPVSQLTNPEIADQLSQNSVRYYHLSERASIGAKRNFAVEKCKGEIIVHWDDDDYFREHRVTAQVAPIISGQVDMTVLEHHYYYIRPTQTFYVVSRPSSWGPHFGTFVYRKALFDAGIRYPDNSVAEDYAFAELALDKGALIHVMNNEDGKHVYVRHHNTWEFNFEDYSLHVEKVDRPSFFSDQDWEHFSTVQSDPIKIKPPNHFASDKIQWNRPEMRPGWNNGKGTIIGEALVAYPPYYPQYPQYPQYKKEQVSNFPLAAKVGIGVGVGGGVALIVVVGLASYFYVQRQKRTGYAPINNNQGFD